MSNGKTVSDADKKSLKSRIASIKRSVASSKYIADEIKKLGTGGKTISNQDFRNLLIDLGLTASQQKKLREQLKDKKYTVKSKKGKPHLKHGGKAKKMRTYKKGGKA